MESEPIGLKLIPYLEWKRVSTGLDRISDWDFHAPNYDVLVDSPIEVGNQYVDAFEVEGIEHEVSIFGPAPVDRRKFVDDIKAIVERTIPVFGHVPYGKYVFLVNFTDTVGGGLEHLNSTMCMVPRFSLAPKEEYDTTMSLFSHEFFHTWNVKRLRPKGLGPFNYSAETYTRSLWIAEGITSYYDDYVLRRTGLYTVAEYLEAFAINVNQMKSLPGRKWQSAQEASFDTWIKYYKTDANAPNATMSYYTQGAVIGWMLDLQIRKNTKGQRNLDEVMRKIYEVTYCKEGRGYSEDEFRATTMEIGGKAGLGEIFDSRVAGREDVDFDRYLDYVGLRLEPKEGLEGVRGFLGIRLNAEGGKATVKARLADSPAEAMGLSENDEIIGVDGFRLSPDKFSFYIANRRPGTTVRVTLARNGVLMELAGGLVQKPAFEYKIAPLSETTEEQRLLFRNWLLEDWKPQIKYPEYLRSPDRKPILDSF
jgi:predicted metalloprotease with PDZ domain